MMTIFYDNRVEWKQYGGGNGNEAPPREEETMTTRATARWRKAAPWVEVAQGGDNSMTTWMVARRRCV
jgi:hypothetical protein